MPRRVRWEQDTQGFGEFMMSPEIAGAAFAVARDVAKFANDNAIHQVQSYNEADYGGPVVAGKRPAPRQTAIVVNPHRRAAADEFGTGNQAQGASAGKGGRRQGGGSPASRHLQRSAARFHDVLGDPE